MFYETGLANGMELMREKYAGDEPPAEKRIVFISQDDKVLFDIQTQNRIRYDRFAINSLEENLAGAIDNILSTGEETAEG